MLRSRSRIKQLKAGFKDDKGFEQAISSAGMTVESLTQQINNEPLTQKLIASLESNDKATEAEIKTYYDKNESQFYQKASKRASHILFKPEDEDQAKKVLAMLKKGEAFDEAREKAVLGRHRHGVQGRRLGLADHPVRRRVPDGARQAG